MKHIIFSEYHLLLISFQFISGFTRYVSTFRISFQCSLKVHASLTVAENALSHQAQHHSDGWGIGYYHLNEPYLFRGGKRCC